MVNKSELTVVLEEIQEEISDDFLLFEKLQDDALSQQEAYLDSKHMSLYKGGKKLRPTLLLLCGYLNAPENDMVVLPNKVIQAAVSLEMMHVATLIHDDIVDHATLRRGQPTINDDLGVEQAVLMGDMQFIQAVRGFVKAIETPKELEIVKRVLDVGFDICKGELDELREINLQEWSKLEERYLKTVDRKTAQLFGISCETGAYLVQGSKKGCFYLSEFGRLFGVAFQIIDDIYDFIQPASVSGKQEAIDLKRGRLSLPIIYALQEFGEDSLLYKSIYGAYQLTDDELEKVIKRIKQSQAIIKSYNKAKELMSEAKDLLQYFKASKYRTYLLRLTDATISGL